MADGDLAPLLQPSNHLPLSTRKNSGSTLMSLDPPEKLTVGERSPVSVLSVLGVAAAWVLLSMTRFPSLFYSKFQIWYKLPKFISPVSELQIE